MSKLKICPECGASVSGENVERHLKKVHGGARSETDRRRQSQSSVREQHRRNETRNTRKRRRGLLLVSSGIATVAVIGLLFAAQGIDWSGTPSAPPNPASACVQHTGTGIHWHVVVRITIAGSDQKVPADIGIRQGCMAPLHTHAADGVIHIEYSGPVHFTLGQFFDLWGEDFDENSLLWYKGPVRMSVDGEARSTYRSQPLIDGLRVDLAAG